MAVIFVVLFSMQAGPTATAALWYPGGFFPRAKPGLPDFGPQAVVRIKLGTGLDERRRGDDRPYSRGFGIGLVIIDFVRITNRTGKHHNMARLDGKCVYGHGCLSPRLRRRRGFGRPFPLPPDTSLTAPLRLS